MPLAIWEGIRKEAFLRRQTKQAMLTAAWRLFSDAPRAKQDRAVAESQNGGDA